MTKVKYVSFDPGKMTGVTKWDAKANPVGASEELTVDELDDFLKELEKDLPEVFIYEAWNLWKDRNKQGDKQLTVRVIGRLEYFAKRHGIKLYESKQSNKEAAAKWSGTKIPKGHMPNWMSSFLHGYFYLFHIERLIRPRVLGKKDA